MNKESLFNFSDIFKKSFIDGWSSQAVGLRTALLIFLVTLCISLYIFVIYRIMTRKTFYSKGFNISLVGVALITAAIIITIQSSIVISLGMVGALSIVRFRTAIKNPMDLMFLFWSISIGIICGAGFAAYAISLSVILTIVIVFLNWMPVSKSPMIMVINCSNIDMEKDIMEIIKKHCKHPMVKARNIKHNILDLTIEVNVKDGEVVKSVNSLQGVSYVALLAHDGEVTF